MLAELRRATVADHASVDALIDQDRLVQSGYYAAVMRGLIDAAEIVEATLPLIPHEMHREGLSPEDVTKRLAIDAEASFLDDLVSPWAARQHTAAEDRPPVFSPAGRASMLGLLYVYVGSGLGGLRMLRLARTAPWWRHERQHLLLRPYGHHLDDRWRAVLNALDRLDLGGTNAAITAARAGFELHRRSLVDHLAAGGYR